MIRKKLEKVRQSIWLYPAIYSIFSLLGALLVIQIDSGYLVNYQESIPSFFLTSTELARMIHGIIAGAFITITTFTFSITMVVLTMYMSQLSPRVVENFLTQKNTMQSFGVFVGGFTYSIVSLLFTRNTIAGYTVISASIGVVYIGVGLVYFVLFINNVATFIQTGNVIDRLYYETKEKIATYKTLLTTHPVVARPRVEDYEGSFSIHCEKNGYIQQIQDRKLFEMVDRKKLVVVFQKVVGQYVTMGEVLFTVYYSEKTEEVQSMADGIRGFVSIGDHKTEKQDFAYTIQKIVEVALRALSPGINDPFTAVQCIRSIGELLELLSDEKYGYIKVDHDPEEAGYVLLEAYCFELMLHDAFDQIVHYGESDIKVMRAVLHALQLLERRSIDENHEAVAGYREYLLRKIESNHFDEFEIKTIKQEYLS
jgi:uncharacterized membrane protein